MSVPLPDGNDRRLDDFPQSGQTACVAVAGASSSRRVRRRFFRESTIATTARRTVRTINRNAVGTPRIRSGGNPASTTVRPTVVDLVPEVTVSVPLPVWSPPESEALWPPGETSSVPIVVDQENVTLATSFPYRSRASAWSSTLLPTRT